MTVKKTQQTLSTTLENTQQALDGLEHALEVGRETKDAETANPVRDSGEGNAGLPDGWKLSQIDNCISIEGLISDGDWIESKDQDPNGGIRLIQLADIGDGEFINKSSRFMNKEAAARLRCTYLKDNDVLIARMPDPLGRACLFPKLKQECVTVVDICMVRLVEGSAFSPKLLMYWINSSVIRNQIAMNATGTTRKRITRKKLAAFDFPVPPLAEQTVIAQTLDTLLAQVDNIKTRLDAIPKILKTFRQSVLAAAVSGKLTEAWRGENGCEAVDETEFVESVTFKQGTQVSSDEQLDDCVEGYTPFLRIINYTQGSKDLKFVKEKASNRIVKESDVVMVRYGATSGFVGRGLSGVLANNLFVIQPGQNLLHEYLYLYLKSPIFQNDIATKVKGGAMPAISFKLFQGIGFLKPPTEEQTEIVRRVEELFAFADQIEQQVKNAQGRVNNLTQSILAKAFRGELTAQWRAEHPDLITGDNSAEALLAKIQAERDALKKSSKPKKKSSAKKTTRKKAHD